MKAYEVQVGMRFGQLTVLGVFRDARGALKYSCRCDCGNRTEVYWHNVKAGRTRSCGCQEEANCRRFKDITGQRFGKLTALSPTEKRTGSGSVIWKCICDCGKEANVSETALMHGSQVSCGCRVQELGKELSNYLHFIDGKCIEFLKRKQRRDNSSGYTGVYRTENGKYKAGITFQQTRYHLGTFATFEEAKEKRQSAERQYHQSFMEVHQG